MEFILLGSRGTVQIVTHNCRDIISTNIALHGETCSCLEKLPAEESVKAEQLIRHTVDEHLACRSKAEGR